ncbi:unnamed protein product [Rotaria sordida]|uniref:Uncharacterized protein n=1 Tax=Rotaria sordida TaxID=392033 RepID=A0A814EZY0_9BILA|nr:unnamed protein product [Rotaria sordida]
MFKEITISGFSIIVLIIFLVSFIYLQYLKVYHISIIRNQYVLDREYYQLKQAISLPSENHYDIEQLISKIRHQRLYLPLPSFAYFSPWIQSKLPSIVEYKPLELEDLSNLSI